MDVTDTITRRKPRNRSYPSPYPQFQSISDPIAYSLGGGGNAYANTLGSIYASDFDPTQAARSASTQPAQGSAPMTFQAQEQTAPSGAPAAPVGGGATPPVDLSGDPVLQQIQALTQMATQQAGADELAGRKGALIGFGYDERLKDLYPDESTAEAARQNKFSTLGNLQHNYDTRTKDLEEEINKRNLFYSGARGTALGENARGYELQQAQAFGGLNDKLQTLRAALMSAQQNAAQQNAQAAGDAYGRYTPPNTGGGGAGGGAAAGGAAGSPDTPAAISGGGSSPGFPVGSVPNPVDPFPVTSVPSPVSTYSELTSPAPSFPAGSVPSPVAPMPIPDDQALLAALLAAKQQYNNPLAYS